MDEPLEAAFELRLHGDAEPSVADGHLGVFLGDTVLFGLHQQFADAVVGIVGDADDSAFDTSQFGRSVVAEVTFGVEDAVDGGEQLLFEQHFLAAVPQVRVLAVVVAGAEIDHHIHHRLEQRPQVGQLVQFDEGAVDGNAR